MLSSVRACERVSFAQAACKGGTRAEGRKEASVVIDLTGSFAQSGMQRKNYRTIKVIELETKKNLRFAFFDFYL